MTSAKLPSALHAWIECKLSLKFELKNEERKLVQAIFISFSGYILLERDYLDPNPTNLSNFTDITLIKILNMNVTRSKQEEYRTGLVALTRNALKNNPMEHLEHQQPTTQVTNTPGAGSSVSVMSPSSLGAPVVINIPVGQAPPPTSFLPPPPFFPFPPPWNDMSPPQQMPQRNSFQNIFSDCIKLILILFELQPAIFATHQTVLNSHPQARKT